ncbi:MAG: lipoyl synthase [Candidatus Latescibacteria bacterium]|nr:lipoyl synthase [Candidatus Latescibacterota bacterium]NIO01034.1 lipoyl synthase [Candidatus Latescibacterota bacterium]NIO27433.1 lipoyl synthase [Candidatus Latescibacterota bacterium]NIO54955.1 lipoyl synthase [Candidatus Latescibacterota bacterium]NIT01044.1 lipoyl synthase [Candidatus Latescibacterota bacterium]
MEFTQMKSQLSPNKKHRLRRPEWLKIALKTNEEFQQVNHLVSRLSLHTVCQEARCPNIYECWGQGTATFMILGDVCTRRCGFCSVTKGKPGPPDQEEPESIAEAVEKLNLDYAVLTSVDRDDLLDRGAGHFARTIRAINERVPSCKIEVLIPDFNGMRELLEIVLRAHPEVLAHNVETVKHLYRRVRPVAVYGQSLKILEESVRYREETSTRMSIKSGIMVGLGETMDQILETLKDIAYTGCDIMTIGQYLSPKKRALPVERFYTPAEFAFLRKEGLKYGFKHVESGPLVRSSYHAKHQEEKLRD